MPIDKSIRSLLEEFNHRLWPEIPPIPGLRIIDVPVPQPWLQGPVPDPWRFSEAAILQRHAELEARNLVYRVLDAASTASAQGGDGAAVLTRLIDEWIHIDDGEQ